MQLTGFGARGAEVNHIEKIEYQVLHFSGALKSVGVLSDMDMFKLANLCLNAESEKPW